jgi:predicted Zn-dependent peptidase
MKYQKYTYNGYNMYFIKTDCFKEIKIRFSFRKPLKKEDITINDFLSNMLVYSTTSFKTQRLFFMEQQRLYNISIANASYRWGNYLFTDYHLNVLNDKYTEKGNMERSIKLLLETIFKPNISDEKFDLSSFKITYSKIKENIDTMREDKRRYAIIRMKNCMEKGAPYSYIMDGYIEDLDKITPSNLYKYYKKWLNSNLLDIFVAGDFNEQGMKNILTSNIPIKIETEINKPFIYENRIFRKNIKKITEIDDVKQAKLVIGCKLNNITNYERQYVSLIYNIIFGSSPTSKLFTVVRKKNSLCYSINSSLDLSFNTLYINAGISKEKACKTIKLIKKLMIEMEEGIIESEKLENAKIILIEDIKSIEDKQGVLINKCQAFELFNYENLDMAEERINSITIKNIKEFAKKVKMDTVFLLQGGDNNGGN